MIHWRTALGVRLLALLGLALVVEVTLTGCSDPSGKSEVHVYNWPDYIDASVLEDFEHETGIRVVYNVFETNDVLERQLMNGDVDADVVMPSVSALARQVDAGLYRELDFSKLPNRDHQWGFVLEHTRGRDPGNAYSVNYMWGTTGVGYDARAVLELMPDAPVDSLDLIFDPAVVSRFADRGVVLVDDAADIVPFALLYLGEDPTSHDPEVLARAEAPLMAIRPFLRNIAPSDFVEAFARGEIAVCIGYSGDIMQARELARTAGKGVDIRYTIPLEGALLWFDQMAIPAEAPHPDAAHRFINYMLEPRVIARVTNTIKYANGNKNSLIHVDEALTNDPAVYPPNQVLERLFFPEPYDARIQDQVIQIWERVKAAGK